MGPTSALPLEAVVMADIAIVLLAGVAVRKLSRRLHQPPVVTEIATGIMLGPSLLGLLPGDLPARLFPDDVRPLLSGIAQVGLLLFMFLAGWDLDISRLRGRGKIVGSTAGLSMVAPFAFGAGAAAVLYTWQGPAEAGAGTFVLYLATAFSITAFPVLARIIRDNRLSRTRVGTLAMACAAIGDVVAWCVLVLVVALAGAGSAGQFVAIVSLTIAYMAAMALGVRPLLKAAMRRTARTDNGVLLLLLVSGALLSSFITSWIGIHAIFGAFAFGLVMPQPQGPDLQQHLIVPLEKLSSLLLPVFFIITGLSVDLSGLGWSGLLALALIIAAAVAGKFTGAAIPARLSGMGWREAGAFGVLMNTRGLTEIVILDIGREMGLIGDRLFTMMVMMALVTTTMAGPLLRLLRVEPPPAPSVREPRGVIRVHVPSTPPVEAAHAASVFPDG